MTRWTGMWRGVSSLFEWLGFGRRRAAESDIVVPLMELQSNPTGPQNPRNRHVHFLVPFEARIKLIINRIICIDNV